MHHYWNNIIVYQVNTVSFTSPLHTTSVAVSVSDLYIMTRQQIHIVGTTCPASPPLSCDRAGSCLVSVQCWHNAACFISLGSRTCPTLRLRSVASSAAEQAAWLSPELSPALSATQAETRDLPCTLHILCGGETLISQLIQSKYSIVAIKQNRHFESLEILYPHLISLSKIYVQSLLSVMI